MYTSISAERAQSRWLPAVAFGAVVSCGVLVLTAFGTSSYEVSSSGAWLQTAPTLRPAVAVPIRTSAGRTANAQRPVVQNLVYVADEGTSPTGFTDSIVQQPAVSSTPTSQWWRVLAAGFVVVPLALVGILLKQKAEAQPLLPNYGTEWAMASATEGEAPKVRTASMQFIRGIDEMVVPDIRLTRSRDGSSGQAIFTFTNPTAFDAANELGQITGLYMTDEEGTVSTTNVTAKFVNGVPSNIEAIYVMRTSQEWDRYMRFMERYAAENGLGFKSS